MIRMCYGKNHVGDRKIGEKEPFENKEETHGLCDACFEFEKIDIQLALKRLREAGWKPGETMTGGNGDTPLKTLGPQKRETR